jgi:hypothetical protein
MSAAVEVKWEIRAYMSRMSVKSDLERLAEAVRQAEAELEAATTRTALNAAAKKLMRAKEELKAANAAASIRTGEPPGAS